MNDFVIANKIELIWSGAVLLLMLIVRLIVRQTVKKVGQRSDYNKTRISLTGKYFNIFFFAIVLAVLFAIWGVELESLGVFFSSVFAVIGIALFAIWSILSNITSGVIMFFTFPYKIGDKIRIHDKDFPIEGIIVDIRAFHLYLETEEGEFVTYPNNLMLQKSVSLLEKDAFQETD